MEHTYCNWALFIAGVAVAVVASVSLVLSLCFEGSIRMVLCCLVGIVIAGLFMYYGLRGAYVPAHSDSQPAADYFLEADCIVWNHKHPVGTSVEYHPVIGDPKHVIRRTRSEASVLSGHTAVVWLEGVPGCVAIEEPSSV